MNILHWRIQRIIDRYLQGTLSVSQKDKFEQHLESCHSCNELLLREKRFIHHVQSAQDHLEIPDSTWGKIQNRILEYEPYPELAGVEEKTKTGWPTLIPSTRWSQVTILLVGILIFSVLLTLYTSQTSVKAIQITAIQGEGIVYESMENKSWQKLSSDSRLKPGEVISTGEFGRISFNIGKRIQVWVNHSSQINLLQNSTTILEITSGELYVSVNRQPANFQVKTPGGLVSVKGTEFSISIDTNRVTNVKCLENSVQITNQKGLVLIQEGYETNVPPILAPNTPVPITQPDKLKWKTEFDRYTKLSDEEKEKLWEENISNGNQYYVLKQFSQALEQFREAAYLVPGNSESFAGMGKSYQSQGFYSQATLSYQLALQKKTEDILIHGYLSQCLMELHQYEQAEKILLEVISHDSSNHIFWELLGDTYLLQGKLDKAESAYQESLITGGKDCNDCLPLIYGGMAEIARQKGNLQRAGDYLERAQKYSILPALVYIESSRYYKDMENKPKEKMALEQYLSIHPNGGFAGDAKNRLNELRK